MNARKFELPKTWAAVKREFPGRENTAIRGMIIDRAYQGEIGVLDYALSAKDHASVVAIKEIFTSEMQELDLFDKDGLPLYVIGEDEHGIAVAFLDQPVGVHP